jgi:DNA polymerase III subunit chi
MKVEFHTGVADRLGLACRFLRKAHAAGAHVVVCGDSGSLDRLDVALWTFDPLSFVPHVRLKGDAAAPPALARTTTWLVDAPAAAPTREILLNLGPAMVDDWACFARVVEIVSSDPADAEAGRLRWRRYGERDGVERVHHARGASVS